MRYLNYIKEDYRANFRRRLLDKLKVIKMTLHSFIKKRHLIDANAFDKFQGWIDINESQMEEMNMMSDRLN